MAAGLEMLCHSLCGSLLSWIVDGSPVLLDPVASPVLGHSNVREDSPTLATLFFTCDSVNNKFTGTCDLAGDRPCLPGVGGGV